MGLYISSPDVTFTPTLPGTAALTSVSQSASSVQLLAPNTARRFFSVHNNAGQDLFIAFAATATTTSFTVKVPKNSYFESQTDGYTGEVSGIWSSAGGGNAKITEVS